MSLRILYRGPLASCNYGCDYCPFAKQVDSRAELADDAAKLDRFLAWVGERSAETAVFFTPWGEALIRRSYRDALVRLTNMPRVTKAAIQTNLSTSIEWARECDPSKLGIWATYHPEWTDRAGFVDKLSQLATLGASVSAGVVGFRPFADDIEALRAELPGEVYLWINANKRDPDYYDEALMERFERVDPNFRTNTVRHASAGHSCRAGLDAISVDGDGVVRRCHFIREAIGNIYDEGFESALTARDCTNETCGCHIGYVHLERLGLREVYGDGLLERVPTRQRRLLQTVA